MKSEKILEVLAVYECRLLKEGVPKNRMDPKRTFESLTKEERLMHAYFLIDGAKWLATSPDKQGKAGRHLGAIQMCLSFAGWYTLEELMNHNRPPENST